MKIVFLDIDGVLNNPGTYAPKDAPWRREEGDPIRIPIDEACMKRLNRILESSGASVVISSSWRLFAHWQELGPALVAHGMQGTVIGETPDLVNDPEWLEAWRTREGAPFAYERMERGMEIAEWLKANPHVTSFAILDDCSDMATLKHRLVLTDPVVGLDDPDVERARWLLNRPREQCPMSERSCGCRG